MSEPQGNGEGKKMRDRDQYIGVNKLKTWVSAASLVAINAFGGMKPAQAKPVSPSYPDQPGLPTIVIPNASISDPDLAPETLKMRESQERQRTELEKLEAVEVVKVGQFGKIMVDTRPGDSLSDPYFNKVRSSIENAKKVSGNFFKDPKKFPYEAPATIRAVVEGDLQTDNEGEATVTPIPPAAGEKNVNVLISAPGFGLFVVNNKPYFYTNKDFIDSLGITEDSDPRLEGLYVAPIGGGLELVYHDTSEVLMKGTINPDTGGVLWRKVETGQNIDTAMSMVPKEFQADLKNALNLPDSDPNKVYFDSSLGVFVKKSDKPNGHIKMWMAGMRLNGTFENGFVEQADKFTPDGTNVTVVLGFDPTLTTGDGKKVTEIKHNKNFNKNFKKWETWISKALHVDASAGLDGKTVFINFSNYENGKYTASIVSTGTDAISQLRVSGKNIFVTSFADMPTNLPPKAWATGSINEALYGIVASNETDGADISKILYSNMTVFNNSWYKLVGPTINDSVVDVTAK